MTRAPGDKGQTRDEKLAYQRGYSNGRTRAWKKCQAIREVAKCWREKARDGFGGARCDTCANWKRSGATTKWGYCSQGWIDSPDLGIMWVGNVDRNARDARLVCHENFACINWRKKDGAP